MLPVPVLRPREVVRAFEKLGWVVSPTGQSHYPDQRRAHSNFIGSKSS